MFALKIVKILGYLGEEIYTLLCDVFNIAQLIVHIISLHSKTRAKNIRTV